MSDPLKRIEEKHKARGTREELRYYCAGCYDTHAGVPCDVMKLARALDAALQYIGDQQSRVQFERVLEEVADDS